MKKNVLLLLVSLPTYTHATTKITAVLGDITAQSVAVLVNAANPQLAAGNGVCGAIFKAAGLAQLQKACNQYPLIQGVRCPVGSACITDSFNLKKIGVQKIVHAVGPDARIIKDQQKQRTLLISAYTRSLEIATAQKYTTIAFPFISSGIYAVDHQLAATAAITAARDFIAENKTTLNEIRFVLYYQDDYDLFQKLLNDN